MLIVSVAVRDWRVFECSSSVQKPEKEIMKEISAIIRQITSSVSFLPLLDQPCQSQSANERQSGAVRVWRCFRCERCD